MLNSLEAVKCIILVSSQAPRAERLKALDEKQKYICTELPKIEAILQLQNSIYKNEISPALPLSLSRLIAYRLWFYLGGNFRAFHNVFGKQSRDLIYLCCKKNMNFRMGSWIGIDGLQQVIQEKRRINRRVEARWKKTVL